VKPMSDKSEFVLPFKKDPNLPGSDTLLPGKSLLTLGANPVGNMMFNGTEDMNGIPCDVWVGCLFIPDGKITINVKYHFSRNDSDARWFTAGGSSSAPIGIHAKGQSAEDKSFKLEQTFNYIYFSEQFTSLDQEYFAKIFETPKHAYCPGRKNVYDLPNVPSQFSFRAEVIDNLANTIQFTREWYDFNANYSRMDFKSPPTGNDSIDITVSPQTIINDFNAGVSYIIDKFSRECTVIPITSGEFDSLPLGPTKTRMRTPREFFDFDKTGKYPWPYMGEHLIRNIATNGWISYRPFPSEGSPLNATWEWYFATKRTVIKAQDLVEDLEPMQVVIKSTEANVDMTYNVYRFSENAPDNRVFDVRNCYENGGSVSFDMQLEGNWTGFNAENNLQLLEYWFTLSVEAFADVRAIRVTDVEFVFYGKRIGVRFTLLGPATIKGDVDNNIQQVSIGDAKDRIVEAFTDGIFQVYFMPDPVTGTTIFVPVPDTLRVVMRHEHPSSYRPTDTPLPPSTITQKLAGMNSGTAAGLGFGMLFLGVLIAGVGIVVYKKRTSDASYPNQRLRNEETE